MTEEQVNLPDIIRDKDYQILIRGFSDNAAQGLLTLLVTINVGAFVTVLELLDDHYWLLLLFTVSTITALLARTGIFYLYRREVDMYEHLEDTATLKTLDSSRTWWWSFTERVAWTSLLSFILGVALLTGFFVAEYY